MLNMRFAGIQTGRNDVNGYLLILFVIYLSNKQNPLPIF